MKFVPFEDYTGGREDDLIILRSVLDSTINVINIRKTDLITD